MIRSTIIAVTIAILSGAVALSPAHAEKKYGPGVSDTEIKIGQTMPYSGPFSSVSAIGKSEAAYFRMINAKGGVNGRHVTFISLDDNYSPTKTLEQTRRLVEKDHVLAIVGSFGTPTNIAVRKHLNSRGVPQLFIQAGASLWNDPSHFPWTIPFVNLLRSEAKVDATYILRTNPNARVAVLYQNDDFGRDYLAGLKEKFGAKAPKMIIATASYEATDPTVDSQVIALQASGANTFFIAAGPKFAAQAIQKAFDLGWRPSRFIAQVSATSRALMPAGFDKAVGIIVATSFKSIDDPQWEHDPDYVTWGSFMRDAYAEGNIADAFNFVGYSNAVLFSEVLRRCGDELTRQNLMNVATHLDHVRMPILLPGITLNTSPTDYDPMKQMRLQRFDGKRWVLFTDVIEE